LAVHICINYVPNIKEPENFKLIPTAFWLWV
jgi:hypothetical protein